MEQEEETVCIPASRLQEILALAEQIEKLTKTE
jgi:hypothetical protein